MESSSNFLDSNYANQNTFSCKFPVLFCAQEQVKTLVRLPKYQINIENTTSFYQSVSQCIEVKEVGS